MRCVACILVGLLLSLSLSGCGQKGPLKLPPDAPVPAPKAGLGDTPA